MSAKPPVSNGNTNESTDVLERVKVKEPSLYKVLLLNDDYTPMDFVIKILQKFFNKTFEQAESIMLQVHEQGRGTAGIYNLEVAETKQYQVLNFAEQNQHPLQCVIEKD